MMTPLEFFNRETDFPRYGEMCLSMAKASWRHQSWVTFHSLVGPYCARCE